jgi:hypothetical protein
LYTRFIPFGHAAGAFSLPFSLLSCTSCHPALFLPFSQLYPTAPGGICEMERWNPYPSKKGMNQKKPSFAGELSYELYTDRFTASSRLQG